jgi:hypothetical protein
MWFFQFNDKHGCRNFGALFENFVMQFQPTVLMPTILLSSSSSDTATNSTHNKNYPIKIDLIKFSHVMLFWVTSVAYSPKIAPEECSFSYVIISIPNHTLFSEP